MDRARLARLLEGLEPGLVERRQVLRLSLLAALASTLDTHLNWGASYWSNDLYRGVLLERWLKRPPSEKESGVILRIPMTWVRDKSRTRLPQGNRVED